MRHVWAWAGREVGCRAMLPPWSSQTSQPHFLIISLLQAACVGPGAGLDEGLSLTTVTGGGVQSGLPAGALLSAPHPCRHGPSPS